MESLICPEDASWDTCQLRCSTSSVAQNGLNGPSQNIPGPAKPTTELPNKSKRSSRMDDAWDPRAVSSEISRASAWNESDAGKTTAYARITKTGLASALRAAQVAVGM